VNHITHITEGGYYRLGALTGVERDLLSGGHGWSICLLVVNIYARGGVPYLCGLSGLPVCLVGYVVYILLAMQCLLSVLHLAHVLFIAR